MYSVASFFAGVGGIDLGFELTKQARTIYANEIDLYPIQTFEANFPIKVDQRDIYDKLVAAMDDSNAVYQWRRKYVRKNMSGVVPTLTANQGEGGHNVCLVKTKQGIRKMTPKECFNTQGFPESFVLPDIADGRLYKQAGNSVCVSVVQRIAEQMLVAMK